MAKILNTYLTDQCKTKTKVVDFHHPHQLEELLGDTLCVDGPPRDLHQVLSDCKETLKYCVKTGKPYPYISISSHRFTRPSLNKEICIVNTCKRRIDVMSYAYTAWFRVALCCEYCQLGDLFSEQRFLADEKIKYFAKSTLIHVHRSN